MASIIPAMAKLAGQRRSRQWHQQPSQTTYPIRRALPQALRRHLSTMEVREAHCQQINQPPHPARSRAAGHRRPLVESSFRRIIRQRCRAVATKSSRRAAGHRLLERCFLTVIPAFTTTRTARRARAVCRARPTHTRKRVAAVTRAQGGLLRKVRQRALQQRTA